jgi:hypothetical protein
VNHSEIKTQINNRKTAGTLESSQEINKYTSKEHTGQIRNPKGKLKIF